MSDQSHLKRQLGRYKDLLANLSRKNREVYYKESKASTINLSKQPFQKGMFAEEVEIKFSGLRSLSECFVECLKSGEFNVTEHFQMDDIRDREALNRVSNKLDKIRLADDRHQREYGISGAWLLGPFLCWRSSAQATRDELLISPIFKIPIDLRRNKRKQMVVEIEDEVLTFNPSLVLALKQFLGITLPDDSRFETPKEGIDFLIGRLAEVQKSVRISDEQPDAVPKIPGKIKLVIDEDGNETRVQIKMEDVLAQWELAIYDGVNANEFMLIDVMYLDQLNASRMVLFNDYDGIVESSMDHPILNELFNGSAIVDEGTADRSKLRELDAYKERDNHFVVDIDSTQHRAIERATKAKALVIQGPPGTGKSQTIVNLIADYLAKGKKVLFVSEKRPALDVVYNRLRSANIDSQAVLIHSSDLNKSDLYQSFLELACSQPNHQDERERESTSNGLDRIKKDINHYADVLQAQHERSGINNAEAMILAASKRKDNFDPKIFQVFSQVDHEDLLLLGAGLDEVQDLLAQHLTLTSSPWLHRLPHTVRSVTLEHELKEIQSTLAEGVNREGALKGQYREITDCEFDALVSKFWSSILVPEKCNSAYEPLWRNRAVSLKESLLQIRAQLAAELATLEEHRSHFEAISPTASNEMIEALEQYYRLPRGFADWFSVAYWSYRKVRQQVCLTWDGSNKQFAGHRLYRTTFSRLVDTVAKISSSSILKVDAHEKTVTAINEYLAVIDQLASVLESLDQVLPAKLATMMADSVTTFNAAVDLIKSAKECSKDIYQVHGLLKPTIQSLSKHLRELPKTETFAEAASFVSSLIERMSELDALDVFDILVSKLAERFQIPDLRSSIFTNLAPKQERWSEVIETSCLFGWVDEINASSPVLRSFDRHRLSEQLKELRVAFERHQASSRQAVHHAFAKRWSAAPRNDLAVGLLKKEATKQRRILSPREVMEKGALKTMLDLKPCWLMSPLSISQMLPLQSCLFDVIIFDEASQVRVEDAIPSIFRATTMMVVGDPKQMPPTNFFAGGVVDDDDEEEEISPSVLDLASQVYPSVLLEWHYRSRSEALIAFSNRAFYGGRLIAAPNPQVITASGSLHFKQIANAYFDGKEGNGIECQAVIDHLIELIRENPKRSYGVIAMGQAQSNALNEELYKRMTEDAEIRTLCESAMSLKDGEADVGLFIKNLENVQGDERDVILVSVGYAPVSPGRKLRMNFGPLGKQGGGRRLNVAITRAKSEMYVFSSFAPAEIKTDEEAFAHNPDLCVFGRYLKYVEAVSTGNLGTAQAILNSFPMGGVITSRKSSRFALDVKRRLEDLGYQVTAEVGSNGFFIDLGIHHPTVPSNFLLGIECDGAMFHSTPYARDRDKIREQLLISRGWKIERIWSQDWSRDWRKEILRIEARIKTILGVDQDVDHLSVQSKMG